jgi:hypothetical protein
MRDVPGCVNLETASSPCFDVPLNTDMMSNTNAEVFQTNTRVALRWHRDARIADHGTSAVANFNDAEEGATHSHMAR